MLSPLFVYSKQRPHVEVHHQHEERETHPSPESELTTPSEDTRLGPNSLGHPSYQGQDQSLSRYPRR